MNLKEPKINVKLCKFKNKKKKNLLWTIPSISSSSKKESFILRFLVALLTLGFSSNSRFGLASTSFGALPSFNIFLILLFGEINGFPTLTSVTCFFIFLGFLMLCHTPTWGLLRLLDLDLLPPLLDVDLRWPEPVKKKKKINNPWLFQKRTLFFKQINGTTYQKQNSCSML